MEPRNPNLCQPFVFLDSESTMNLADFLAQVAKPQTKKQAPKAQAPKAQAPKAQRSLAGVSVCMTGFRDAAMEAAIVAAGGIVASGVSKHLGLLVAKDPRTASGKAQKARELGIPVLSIPQMNARLAGQASAPQAQSPRAQTPRAQRAPRSGDPLEGGVLLAEKWTPATDPTGYWMSEKLDGVRAYWDGEGLYSRNGNRFFAPSWFTDLLPADTSLDGELYMGPGRFNEAVSIVRSKTPDARWRSIQYRIFDAPSGAPFEARMERVADVVVAACEAYRGDCPIVRVQQTRCRSPKHLGEFHARVTAQGIEGTMLRAPGSPYERRRSASLLKVKDFHDAEARVVGYVPGEGKHRGRLGAYEAEDLQTGARFRVGTGMSDRQRENPAPKGSVITYRYQELTPAGIPRFPSFVAARDYE
jgi:DNA ligase 1